jgi:inorganic pyrophosphatase
MADFNQILTPGDVDGGIINVVIEIPTGSTNKIEWNRELAAFQLDRVEPAIFAKPTNSAYYRRATRNRYFFGSQGYWRHEIRR